MMITMFVHHCSHSQIGIEQGKCGNDYITVGDTETELPHPRYTACGNKTPTWQFYSTGNRATVKLLITSQLENVAVIADVSVYVLNKTNPKCWDAFIRVETGRFVFSFPPNGVTLNGPTQCDYTVLGSNSNIGRMTFVFDSINIPNKGECYDDHIELFDESYEVLIPKYCGNTLPSKNVTAEGNAFHIWVKFTNIPRNSSVKGYIYHEIIKQDETASTTTRTNAFETTSTAQRRTTTETTAGISGTPRTILEPLITMLLIITTWND
ncbi:hypothetical protein D915_007053 [Fasciola hepatica]|uniref:CUB domain-containing protein n=1 Tax=Fasciola hepatica TaxID=6192 RepID=A0A4E0R4S4_FASHE|nr:hypothetical protein D915_007053 [Fasciola hepatica]